MGSHEIVLSTLDCQMEVAVTLKDFELQFTLREPLARGGRTAPMSESVQPSMATSAQTNVATTVQATIIGAMNAIGELKARGYRYAEELIRLLVRAMQVQLAS